MNVWYSGTVKVPQFGSWRGSRSDCSRTFWARRPTPSGRGRHLGLLSAATSPWSASLRSVAAVMRLAESAAADSVL
jgi:hypothetical protein